MAGVAEGHTLPIRLEGSKRQQAFCRRGLAFLSRMIASIFLCGERAKGVVFCLSTVVRRQGFGPQQGASSSDMRSWQGLLGRRDGC